MRHTESLLSQSQPRSSWGNLLARRMPFDVRIPGFLLITLGVYSAFIEVLLIAGIARPAETLDWLPRLLVRAGLKGGAWISAYSWETAAQSVVTGMGILRGRRWGWWLLFIFTITGVVLYAEDLGAYKGRAITGLTLDACLFIWLFFRIRLYRPWHQRR